MLPLSQLVRSAIRLSCVSNKLSRSPLKHVSRLLTHVILSYLVVAASPLCGEETTSINGRIVSDHVNAEWVWLGVFVGSVEQETEAWSWTSVATTQFSLEIPDTKEDLTLVALRKNSVPITTRITQELRDSEITLEFERGQVFSGLVLSTDGIAVSDALLKVRRLDGTSIQIPSEAELEWTTNEDGTFSIGGLVESSYELHVALTYVPKESFFIQIKDGEDKQQDLVLADAYHMKGRVVDQSGEAVDGATVNSFLDPPMWKDTSGNLVLGAEMGNVRGYLEFHRKNSFSTTSDSKGAFQLGPFVSGQGLNVSASHTDGRATNDVKVFSGNHDVTLVLSDLVEVLGTVVDAKTGVPIEQFTLRVRGRATSEIEHADASGRISAQIDPAAWGIVIFAPKYVPYFKKDLKLDSLDLYDLGIVELDPGTYMSGQVYDLQSRQPDEGVLLESWVRHHLEDNGPLGEHSLISRFESGVRTRSDVEGEFSIGPVPSDESYLKVEAHGYKSEEIVFDPHVSRFEIGLTARDAQNTKIVARIQTASGEPIRGDVVIYHVEESRYPAIRPMRDGGYEYLAYPGTYKVWAVSSQGRSKTVDVNLVEGQTEEVVLVVDPSGRLRGTITGLKRAEDPFVTVLSGNNLVQATGVVSNGSFALEGIGTGLFTVRVQTSMNRQLEQSFELSKDIEEAFVEIAFEGNSRLHGKVTSFISRDRNSQIRAIGKEKGSISGWGDLLDDGSFEIRGLSDGEYWIEIGDEREIGISSSNEESEPVRYEAVVVGDTELTIDLASP